MSCFSLKVVMTPRRNESSPNRSGMRIRTVLVIAEGGSPSATLLIRNRTAFDPMSIAAKLSFLFNMSMQSEKTR